jgi:hypothetical protein
VSRGKFAGIESLALFPLMAKVSKRAKGEQSKRVPVVGWGDCPRCVDNVRVAMIRSGQHLIWREHTITTWGGAKMTCTGSLVALCDLAPGPGEVRNQGPRYCPHPYRPNGTADAR